MWPYIGPLHGFWAQTHMPTHQLTYFLRPQLQILLMFLSQCMFIISVAWYIQTYWCFFSLSPIPHAFWLQNLWTCLSCLLYRCFSFFCPIFQLYFFTFSSNIFPDPKMLFSCPCSPSIVYTAPTEKRTYFVYLAGWWGEPCHPHSYSHGSLRDSINIWDINQVKIISVSITVFLHLGQLV